MAASTDADQQSADIEAQQQQYENERASKERQKREAEAAKAAIERKIERLRAAYSTINTIKANAKVLDSGVKNQGKKMDDWIGQKYNAYAGYVNGDFKSYYSTYISDIDDTQDEINREISRLQIQAAEYGTRIDRLWARICQLGRWIQNLFN